MSMSKKTPQREQNGLSLETRLKRLEEIVDALDSDELELEKALSLFEEGIGHVKGAQTLLAEAELRVEELLGPEGALESQEMEQEGE
jgi:exodeoxyribonuclease VII small subunit